MAAVNGERKRRKKKKRKKGEREKRGKLSWLMMFYQWKWNERRGLGKRREEINCTFMEFWRWWEKGERERNYHLIPGIE